MTIAFDQVLPHIQSFTLNEEGAPNIIVRKIENGYFLVNNWGGFYIGNKGKAVLNPPADLPVSLETALTQAEAILQYFRDPLPPEDVTEWLKWITDISHLHPENDKERIASAGEENKVYHEFAELILNGKQEQALKFIQHQDTFIREGIIDRIWKELEHPTINRK